MPRSVNYLHKAMDDLEKHAQRGQPLTVSDLVSLKEMANKLKEMRAEIIVRLRFKNTPCQTLGDLFGISPARVSQIYTENKAKFQSS